MAATHILTTQLRKGEMEMTATLTALAFDQSELLQVIDGLSDEELDGLAFGVIGIDQTSIVQRYNLFESKLAGLSRERVLGNHLFEVVAPCMNNYLVAQKFEDARVAGQSLDHTLDYVFTLKMRPKSVTLRLLANPATALRYVLVQREPGQA